MSQDNTDSGLFDVVFFGILQPGKDKETALENLSKLFKTDLEKLRPLFSGGRKVIKGNVDEKTAAKYMAALENVGLIVKLEACTPQTITAASEQPSADTTETRTSEETNHIDTSALTVAEVGADVLEHPPEKEVQEIEDFSFLTMAEVGADVLEHPVEVKPQPIADISDLSLEKTE